ncbi:MAG TPA: hypothetical protein VNW26_03175 [Steroidobacteraceae bacterium]|nr:hypothetical protein [Steroidobacteraceae bacterium]
MTTDRRTVLGSIVGSAVLLATEAATHSADPSGPQQAASPARDFDFLFGNWSVQHRRLKARLTDCTEWQEFPGTCQVRPILGGAGNVDDNVIELPAGSYTAASIRVFDATKQLWSIWWIDSRTPNIDPPVRGSFASGDGTFFGDDELRGKPVRVRYLWSHITADSAEWEQAFSPDAGATWETNWFMKFTRLKSRRLGRI